MIPVQTSVFRNRPPGKLPHPFSEARFVLQNTASAKFQKCLSRETSRYENAASVWEIPQSLKVEDVKPTLSCETSLQKWKWKMWNRSFPAKLPSKSESGRCENEAFVRDFPQKVKLKLEDVKMEPSCGTSLKIWKWRRENEAFVRRLPFQNSFNSISFNSFNSFLRSFILGHHRFNSIQFKSFNSIRSFNLWFLAIINIRNTEVRSNFLWWGRESARQECLNGWLIELCKRWMISCMGKSLSHKWVICYQMIANDSDRLIKWLNDT